MKDTMILFCLQQATKAPQICGLRYIQFITNYLERHIVNFWQIYRSFHILYMGTSRKNYSIGRPWLLRAPAQNLTRNIVPCLLKIIFGYLLINAERHEYAKQRWHSQE
jgi:hypothetical protein